MKKLFSLRSFFYLLFLVALGTIFFQLNGIKSKLETTSKLPSRPFSLAQVTSNYPHNPNWDVATPQERTHFVNMITQQPFHMLGKGFQVIAFVSKDGHYVLKLFLQSKLQPPKFWHKPLKKLAPDATPRSDREIIFTSSKMAFEEFPEESGILYAHLNRTEGRLNSVKLYDANDNLSRLRPDTACFVVQRRAHYVLPTIRALMEKGDEVKAKERLNQLFTLLLTMAKKGYLDEDHALVRNNNIGFADTGAIYIDTGNIRKHDHVDLHARMVYEFDTRMGPLYGWLTVEFPGLAQHYREQKESILNQVKDLEARRGDQGMEIQKKASS